ncbi:MAG TPA: hypothetical protein DEB24_04015, partial [Coriobacteriia bacterium]|nr:hypothetical protein [Coriobacteriia bacterium]
MSFAGDYIVAAYARDLRAQKQMLAELMRLQTDLEDALHEARAANESKSKFLAIMSHEMRTP